MRLIGRLLIVLSVVIPLLAAGEPVRAEAHVGIASAAMSLSSVSVIGNALRLGKVRL